MRGAWRKGYLAAGYGTPRSLPPYDLDATQPGGAHTWQRAFALAWQAGHDAYHAELAEARASARRSA